MIPYTETEISFIRANRMDMHDKEIAKALGRTYRGIKNFAQRKGILKCKRLTDYEKRFIDNSTLDYKEIAKQLNRPKNTIKTYLWRLKQTTQHTLSV